MWMLGKVYAVKHNPYSSPESELIGIKKTIQSREPRFELIFTKDKIYYWIMTLVMYWVLGIIATWISMTNIGATIGDIGLLNFMSMTFNLYYAFFATVIFLVLWLVLSIPIIIKPTKSTAKICNLLFPISIISTGAALYIFSPIHA